MTAALIQTQTAAGVMTLTMNRAEKKNALTVAMYQQLVAALRAGAADKHVRVMVLQGAGGCFTSGNDLTDFRDTPPAGNDSPVSHFLTTIATLEKPLLAAVQGPAIGVGATVLLHCDMSWADDTAKFRMPFVSLGLCPEGASSFLLPRIMGHARASELLMFDDVFDARTALGLGLITGVLPSASILADVHARAKVLAQKPPASVRATKELLRRATRTQVLKALSDEGEVFTQRLRSEEAMEAFMAFFEKRAPDFSRFE